MMLNLGVGPYRAPAPWLNVDLRQDERTFPDLLGDAGALPFRDGSAERVHLGHLLEHIPWPDVPAFLAETRRVLQEKGQLLVVGPDVRRIVAWYCDGRCGDDLLYGALEDQTLAGGDRYLTHKWNMTEGRVVLALEAAGFRTVVPVPMTHANTLACFAVPSDVGWQCAVLGVN